mmetsp:Transcript_33778/g.107274  ORF Transcript_33778/g.107274 Transcript_33778/m.107274 type:complete len:88 (-) Transcript_33778:38-301(-)
MVPCLEKIHSLLRPGGLWVNIGPLEYHGPALPLALSDVTALAKDMGFQESKVPSGEEVMQLPYFERPHALKNFQIREAALMWLEKGR